MGLMDKSLEARRSFTASNIRMLEAISSLAQAGEDSLLKYIKIDMPVSVYEYLIDNSLYSSIKREKSDRRATDRRSGDRRHSGKR